MAKRGCRCEVCVRDRARRRTANVTVMWLVPREGAWSFLPGPIRSDLRWAGYS
jgi:hypothetical protein